LVVTVFAIGPQGMPEYAAKLARALRQVSGMADTAKEQLREQMGSDFDDVDCSQHDPRQYDPRRIVREALMDGEPGNVEEPSSGQTPAGGFTAPSSFKRHDSDKPTP
jgi:sec-independent protein translocase protein TatB